MPKKKKPPYDDTLRFRAFKILGARIARIVRARGYGEETDFMREGMTKLVEQEEKRLGLPPLLSARVAEEPSKTRVLERPISSGPKGPTKYGGRKRKSRPRAKRVAR